MRLFHWIAVFSLILATFIVGVTVFLSPDDMIGCDKRPSKKEGCGKVDAIVAISGGDTDARTKKAIGLYQDGWADLIVFSGAAQDKTGPSNAKVMHDQAIKYGIPEGKIIIDEVSSNTSENAAQTQQILNEKGLKSVILVTSGYHQRRASMEFSLALPGIRVVNSPVNQDNQWSFLWWVNPFGWYLALSELLKITIVSIKGAI